ncbi:MAG TPA: ATP-binding protein [Chloroflexota bacterium]|nr:ATP-binding protein [Chloroflexota bacterium]
MADQMIFTQDDTVAPIVPRMAQDTVADNVDFLAALSHELRMPLTAIRGFAQLLLTHWEDLSEEKRRRNVEQIMRSTLRMERLVGDISLATRLVDDVNVQLGRADVAALVEEALEEVFAVHGSRLFLVEAPVIARPVLADRERVAQILINLLDNAAKYSPAGTPIVVRWYSEGAATRIEVADRGIGLSSEEQTRLFARFSRLRATRNASGLTAGAGLGLYICRRLVEAMDGKIGVQAADEGTGNTFWFTLPLAAV